MSSAGIDSINSGPLILRTYNNSSPNKSIVLENYDNPVSSNYILITSSNGLLAPSDNIYVSSITVSTFSTNSSFFNHIDINYALIDYAQISSLIVSTLSSTVGWISSLEVSTLNGAPVKTTVDNLWGLDPALPPNGNMYNINAGKVGIYTNTNILAPFHVNGNTLITGASTTLTGGLYVNSSTTVSDYLSTNVILMNSGSISSNGALSFNSNDVFINSVNDGDANLHLFNNKTVISTNNPNYNGCYVQLDDSGPEFKITNLNASQTYAKFTSTANQVNNTLTVLAPDYIKSYTHYLTVQNNFAGTGATQSDNVVSQINMVTLKGQYTWWLTDTEKTGGDPGLQSTHLQLYAYNYTAIGGTGQSKEIIDIDPTGSTIIQGDFRIGTTYAGTAGNLSLNGYIKTPSTISSPILAMSTLSAGNGQILGVSTINNIPYPYPEPGIVPLGGIIMWSGSNTTLPTNWALCDGGIYGATNIVTPDLRGRFIMGATYASGTTRYTGMATTSNSTDENGVTCSTLATKATGGEQQHLLTTAQIPSHTHDYIRNPTGTTAYDTTVSFPGPPLTVNTTATFSSEPTGGSESHNNIPQYYVLAYIMRVSSFVFW